jgi:hypothetical protein
VKAVDKGFEVNENTSFNGGSNFRDILENTEIAYC